MQTFTDFITEDKPGKAPRKPRKRTAKAKKKADALKEWADAVKVRDGHKCVMCGATESLSAHHIMRKRLWTDFKLDLENGVTLCKGCHLFRRTSAHLGEFFFNEWVRRNRPDQWKHLVDAIQEELDMWRAK